MLARAGTAKKAASKFEDSDSSSQMSRPRAMYDPPHRPATRVPRRLGTTAAAAVGSEARHRALGAGRGTAPRSPLHEKKPAGAGSRVAELEAKLGQAHDQLTGMREQLAAAQKARKDAHAPFIEAKNRFSFTVKHRDAATSAPAQDEGDHVLAKQKQLAGVATDDHRVTNGGDDETRSTNSPFTGVLEPTLSESDSKRGQVDEQVKKTSDDGDDVNNNIAIVADGEGKRGHLEADELRSKLEAKDREVYEVRAKLIVRDMEVHELMEVLTAKETDITELAAKLVAMGAQIAVLGADNAALVKTASEAAEATREMTAANASETERALREREARLAELLAVSERAREALEAEARRSRVQNDQWRKAAEEAAAVLGGAGHHVGAPDDKDMRRQGSVRGSGVQIDKQDADGEGSGEKRKSGGAVRLLADLWKKKAPK